MVQDAVSAGFDFNGVINGVKASVHHGPHNNYNELIRTKIYEWKRQNPDYTPEQAKSFLEHLAKRLKPMIQNNPEKVNHIKL